MARPKTPLLRSILAAALLIASLSSAAGTAYAQDGGEVLGVDVTITENCGEDWSCTRAYFRELYQSSRETGIPNK